MSSPARRSRRPLPRGQPESQARTTGCRAGPSSFPANCAGSPAQLDQPTDAGDRDSHRHISDSRTRRAASDQVGERRQTVGLAPKAIGPAPRPRCPHSRCPRPADPRHEGRATGALMAAQPAGASRHGRPGEPQHGADQHLRRLGSPEHRLVRAVADQRMPGVHHVPPRHGALPWVSSETPAGGGVQLSHVCRYCHLHCSFARLGHRSGRVPRTTDRRERRDPVRAAPAPGRLVWRPIPDHPGSPSG
jgi:hypothetical protein